MFRVDLHTHSQASPDGGLSITDYKRAIEQSRLDFIAITDHGSIDFACELQKELGDTIIAGEEITAHEGELVGLYLTKKIPADMSALETAKAIRFQKGLVYVPHPFETVRKGLPLKTLDEIAEYVDIVEVHNGRAMLQNKGKDAFAWAEAHGKAMAASSDAHGFAGWGKTYTVVNQMPTRDNLMKLLRNAGHHKGFVGARGVLYPKFNRLKKKFGHA